MSARASPRVTWGWDIGGAQLKATRLEQGRLHMVTQVACPLWRGMHELDRAFDAILFSAVDSRGAAHAVTMTGEMADVFGHREAGVRAIGASVVARFAEARFFTLEGSFERLPQAIARWRTVASANWKASALLAARAHRDALFIDVGSTTTDVVPIRGGRVAAIGVDDASRLAADELVYHGVTRTPLCALRSRVRFRGADCNVVNEFFATSADVYRLLGELAPEHDPHPAADKGDKDERATCARLARMIGHDAQDASIPEWRALARVWRRAQLLSVRRSVDRVASRHGAGTKTTIIGAGCGAFLAEDIAHQSGRRYVPFAALLGSPCADSAWATVCAPSVAVAMLLDAEGAPCGS